MIIKILAGVIVLLAIFLIYVATRDGRFRYERSGVINAPAATIFPYISNFKLGALWSPYEKTDPNMKKTFSGTDGQVGAVMEFDGNRDAGSGKLEMLKVVPNEAAELRLTMVKPFHAENIVTYQLTPEGAGTRFTWSMSGDGGFMGKLMTVLIDCEKMIGDQFTQGINNLKAVVESQAHTGDYLNETPTVVQFPESHFVFVEKIGPFQETAQKAWGEVTAQVPELLKQVKITGGMSLYKIEPQMIYRAGFVVSTKPENLPSGLQYMKFAGGKYTKFVVTGSYANLGPATGRVFEIAAKTKIDLRQDFNIENYVNDPKTTPEAQLITEIMLPTK